MAYALTYSSLVAELQAIVESTNDEFVAEIPRIIARAQDRVQQDLNLAMWRTFENHHVSVTSAVYPRKPNWLKVLSWHLVNKGRFLEQRTLDYVRMYGAGKGTPKYWCERSETEFQFAPKPDNNYNVEVEILTRLPALSPSNPTNWISNNAADLLLLQSLIGSEMFLQAPERVSEFITLYGENLKSALNELNGTDRSEYEPVRQAAKPIGGTS